MISPMVDSVSEDGSGVEKINGVEFAIANNLRSLYNW